MAKPAGLNQDQIILDCGGFSNTLTKL